MKKMIIIFSFLSAANTFACNLDEAKLSAQETIKTLVQLGGVKSFEILGGPYIPSSVVVGEVAIFPSSYVDSSGRRWIGTANVDLNTCITNSSFMPVDEISVK
jgi:hypothetical protein